MALVDKQIFKEEVFDLLDQNSSISLRTEGVSQARPTIPAKVPIQIRETPNGGITLAGVTEAEVRSKEEMASFLARGSLSRATGSTNMNSQSRLTVSCSLNLIESSFLIIDLHFSMIILVMIYCTAIKQEE